MPITRTPYFSPTSIGGCALWLDGADPAGNGVIPVNGSTVSTWVDKSGNSKNGSQVNNPTYDLTRKAIYFTGSSQYYTLPDSTFPTGNTSYSYFIIVNFTGLGTGSGIPTWAGVLGGGGFTPSTSIAFRTNGAGGGFYEYWYANDNFSSTTYATNQIVAIESFYTSGGQRSLIQNFSVTTTNTPSTPRNQSSGNNVIGRTFSTEYMIGYIHEVIVYNFDLITSQRQQVESYLAQKWGLQSQLPQGHLSARAILYRGVKVGTTSVPLYTQFSPTSIPGCVLWLDAADATKITLSGSNVTQIVDKSSNAYTFTGSVGTYPTRTVSINGLPVISTSTGKFLQITNFNQNFTIATFFSVLRPTEDITPNGKSGNGYAAYGIVSGTQSGDLNFVVTYANQSQSGDPSKFFIEIDKQGTGFINGALGGASPSTYNPVNTPLNIGAVMSGSSGTNFAYLNGTSVNLTYNVSGTFPLQSGRTVRIFHGFGCDHAEVLIYGSALTTTQRQTVESYLAQKWGLGASLPNPTHINFTQPAGLPTSLTLATAKRGTSYISYPSNYFISNLFYYSIGPSYWTANWQLYLQHLVRTNSSATATVNLGAITASGTNYQGLVLAPNGYIYCVPCNGTSVGYINPANGQFGTFGSSSSGGFVSGALAPNGNIYCMKFYGGNIGIITPGASPASSTWSESGPSIGDSRFSCCFGPDGLLYIPSPNAANIGVYTPGGSYSTTYLTNVGTITGGYAGAVLAPNGKIYCIPSSATNVGVIDTVARTFTVAGLTVTGSATGYRGGVLGANGKIYCLPNSATKVGVIDPDAGTFNDGLITNTGTPTRYMSGVLGADGKIYCTPDTSGYSIGVINTILGTFNTIGGTISATNGILLAPNGTIYTAPTGSSAINTITFSGLSQLPNSTYCLSAYTNKI